MQQDGSIRGGLSIMSNKNKEIYSVDRRTGEIKNECLHHNNRKRFKADTPFDNSIIPYLIMVFCATVDGVVFYGLSAEFRTIVR